MLDLTAQRLDISLTDAPTVQKAERLMTVLGTGSEDLFHGALDVFDWCVRQVQEGRHIMAINEAGTPTSELSTPLLDTAREPGRLMLHADAFDEVVRVLDRPDQPTTALRDLMA